MERQRLIIMAAALLNPDSVRLRVIRAEHIEENKALGKARGLAGTWVEWESAQGRALFKNSRLAFRARKLAIPAVGTMGSDAVHDLEIEWEKDFPLKRLLMAYWVMGS